MNRVFIFVCLLVGDFFGLSFSINHIIVVGKTGTGKSYLLNRLAAAGEAIVATSQGDDSCTLELTTRVAFNGELITEVPGYLDTRGENTDKEIQRDFIQFLKNKTIRAVVFVYTERTDTFMKAAASAFTNTELRNNLIFVKNKVDPNTPDEVSSIKEFPGIPKISVKFGQNELETLKNTISAKNPVTPNYLIVPFSLFSDPLDIVRDEVIQVFVEDRSVVEKVTIRRTVQDGTNSHCKWASPTWLSKCCTGKKTCWEEPKWREISEEQMVPKPYRVFEKLKLSYAKRFDSVADIYRKQHLEFVTIPVS